MKKGKLTKGILKSIAGGFCYGLSLVAIPTFVLGVVGTIGGGFARLAMEEKSEKIKASLEKEARPAIVQYWNNEVNAGNMTQDEALDETVKLIDSNTEYVYQYVKDNEVLSEQFDGYLKKVEENDLKCKVPKDILNASLITLFSSGVVVLTGAGYEAVTNHPIGKRTLESGTRDICEAKAEKSK